MRRLRKLSYDQGRWVLGVGIFLESARVNVLE